MCAETWTEKLDRYERYLYEGSTPEALEELGAELDMDSMEWEQDSNLLARWTELRNK